MGLLGAAALLCAACQGAEPPATAPEDGIASVEISWALCVNGQVGDAEAVSRRLSERMPELRITFLPIDSAMWSSRINAIVASGEVPDILYQDGQELAASYAERKIIRELPFETAKEYAPHIYRATLSYGREVWLATQVNGANYGLPLMQPNQAAPYSDQWRMDMLMKLGIDRVPETLAEAEEAFSRAILADLNGSGKNDTYGLSFRGKDQTERLFSSVFGAFGTLPGRWMLEDEQLVWGMMRDEAKEALALLADWYQKGYIDPSFVTTDSTTFTRKVANGNMLMNCGALVEDILPPDGVYSKLAREKNPKAELVPGPPLRGPAGESGYDTRGKAVASLAFGNRLTDERLRLCLRAVDFLATEDAAAEYVLYGEKGADWEQNPQTNALQSLDPLLPDAGQHLGSYLTGVPAREERWRHPLLTQYSLFTEAGTLHPEEDYITWAGAFAGSGLYAVKAEADRDFQKNMIDIIVGELPVDAYEESRENWYLEGGAWVTEEMNRAYRQGKLRLDDLYAVLD